VHVTDSANIAAPELFCPECCYNLTGISSTRCPECGHELDWSALQHSRIPWIYRNEIGSWRAYWRTVWLTMLDSRLISDDVRRPVNLGDARRFRRITVWLAFVPIAMVELWMFITFYPQTTHWSLAAWSSEGSAALRLGWIMDWLALPVMWFALYLFLLAATGVQSWFFHPAALPIIRQNRAVALSYYACAPLAGTPISLGALAICIAVFSHEPFRIPLIVMALAFILVGVLFALQSIGWWLNLIRLLRRTTQCTHLRAFAIGGAMPVLWLVLGVVIAIGIPAIYVFVCLVILSLM